VLIVTKALGTGIILAAQMQLQARAGSLDAALDSMLMSNGPAVAVLARHGVQSCTDITGFGLLGHLLEMCRASACSAELDAEAAPLLPGVLSLVAQGVASTLKPANDAALAACHMAPRWHDHPLLTLLTDPQTSGGLLAAVAPTEADACLLALRKLGLPAARIGTFRVAGAALLELS
jgi:selenide, water dikinase